MTRYTILMMLGLAGCAGDALLCGASTTELDGTCVGEPPPDDPATVEAALDALPDCEPALGDGRLDLGRGCADEVCVRTSVSEISRAMDEVPECEPDSGTSLLRCRWSNGVAGLFPDIYGNGQVYPGAEAYWLEIGPAFDGTTEQGIGVGQGFRCFTEALGRPDRATLGGGPAELTLHEMSWHRAKLTAGDDSPEEPDLDGIISELTISGL